MLGFSYIDPTDPVGVPPMLPNGGLYTGQEPPKGAGWGAVPITPDAIPYSEHVYEAARHHIPGYTRPGNNTINSPYHRQYDDVKNYPGLMCRK